MAKYRHLTLMERIEIYSLLKENKSLRKIAKALKRNQGLSENRET